MKHIDFDIGTAFLTSTGQVWRCTDVGTRTILAIEIHRPDQPDRDPSWFVGPPYSVQEVVFDEDDIRGAYQSFDEHVLEALYEHGKGGHTGFPQEVVSKMMKSRVAADTHSYPKSRYCDMIVLTTVAPWCTRLQRIGRRQTAGISRPTACSPKCSVQRLKLTSFGSHMPSLKTTRKNETKTPTPGIGQY